MKYGIAMSATKDVLILVDVVEFKFLDEYCAKNEAFYAKKKRSFCICFCFVLKCFWRRVITVGRYKTNNLEA